MSSVQEVGVGSAVPLVVPDRRLVYYRVAPNVNLSALVFGLVCMLFLV